MHELDHFESHIEYKVKNIRPNHATTGRPLKVGENATRTTCFALEFAPGLKSPLEPFQETLRIPESRESKQAFQTSALNADGTAFCVLTSLDLPLKWENRSKSQSHVTFRTGGVASWPLPPAVLLFCRGPRLFLTWLCAGAGWTIAAGKLFAQPMARGCVHWKYRARESRCTVKRIETGTILNAGP